MKGDINSSYTDQESDFAKAFSSCHASMCSVECDCGRVFFVSHPGHGDYEDGELKELTLKSEMDQSYFECSEFDGR